MKQYLELGNCPYNEEGVQVSKEEYLEKMILESLNYITLLRIKFPQANKYNCKFSIKSFPSYIGNHQEVVINYDTEDGNAIRYAFFVDSHLPAKWSDDGEIAFDEKGSRDLY